MATPFWKLPEITLAEMVFSDAPFEMLIPDPVLPVTVFAVNTFPEVPWSWRLIPKFMFAETVFAEMLLLPAPFPRAMPLPFATATPPGPTPILLPITWLLNPPLIATPDVLPTMTFPCPCPVPQIVLFPPWRQRRHRHCRLPPSFR
jgi:hypothetical protein